MKFVIFNSQAGKNDQSRIDAENFAARFGDEAKLLSVADVDYAELVSALASDDEVYLFGGDGTLNRFVNAIGDKPVKNNIYYRPTGSGNDFSIDVGHAGESEPFLVNRYIKNLPTVTVNGVKYKFINGVGYGIDGYCCEVGDKLKAEGQPVNYTTIAIKGLLFHFKLVNATVIVDGRRMYFEKVWIAPTMYGSHYGGGMIPTPEQHRGAKSQHLSLMVFHGTSKLSTLMIFPSIFKGEHVKHKDNITVLEGREITVKFDRPTPLQIDGETVLGVTEYTAKI